jgi:hypothetical protein
MALDGVSWVRGGLVETALAARRQTAGDPDRRARLFHVLILLDFQNDLPEYFLQLGVTDHIWSIGELVDAALKRPSRSGVKSDRSG